MRDAWTDPRLDDLNHRVDSGFKETTREFQAMRLEMRTELAAVRTEMATEFAAVRLEMRTEFRTVRSELGGQIEGVRSDLGGQIAALHRTILQLFGGMMATFVVGFTAILIQL